MTLGARVLLSDRVEVGIEKTFRIPFEDADGPIESSAYTFTGTFLKPDGTTEVAVTPTLVSNTSGRFPYDISVTLTAANNTAPAAADVGKPWLLNIYQTASGGNAEPYFKAFIFYAKPEWE